MSSLLTKIPASPPGKTGWPWTEESKPPHNGKSWPKISIVTPSYNQGEFLEETIRSVLLQNYPNLEYIIMDGGSTDNSVEIIKKYEPWLKYWVSKKDGGQSGAINDGFALADGTILGWLNSDDVYYPGTLQKVASMDWKKSDFCYGKGMWISRSGSKIGLYPTLKPNKYAMYHTCTLCQPTVFFNKKAHEDLGQFSNKYYCAFDYEYWIRALFKGKKFKFTPQLLAQSRMYHENKSLSEKDTVLKETNAIIAMYYKGSSLNPVIKRIYEFVINYLSGKRLQALASYLHDEAR